MERYRALVRELLRTTARTQAESPA